MSGVKRMMTSLESSIKECASCVNMDWKTGALCATALTFIGIIAYYFLVIRKKQMESFEYAINREPSDSSATSKQAELMFFYADWCPHCVKAKPEWAAVRSEYEGKSVNGYTMKFKDVDCTSETEESEKMIDKYKVEGYPTLKLLKDGQIIEYDAKVTKDTIDEFLNTML